MTSRRRLGAVGVLGILVALLCVAPLAARPALRALGRLVVAEDPAGPADLAVLSNAAAKASALEAVRLWQAGAVQRIVVAPWQPEPLDARLAALGVRPQRPEELVEAVLRAGGVPPDRIVRLPVPSNGTRTELLALAALLRTTPAAPSVLYITARSHTARARWLARRALPGTDVRVRSSAEDAFDAESWWRHRQQARDLAMEYLRWAATLAYPGG